MIEVSISAELAAEHLYFLAGCGERGHRVQVFDSGREQRKSDAAEAPDPDDHPTAAYIGQPDARA
jgi:hypothetical protein